jgi:hypothetical protein
VLTIVCKLTYPDGQTVTAKLQAQRAGVPYRVEYSGAFERLPLRPLDGTPSDLELIFRLLGDISDATLSVERFGAYESRAAASIAA